jgi:hypothetical protein
MNKKIDLKALLESKMGEIEPAEDSRAAIEGAEMSIPKNLMFDAESTEFKPETKPVTASGARGLTVEEAKTFNDEMSRFIETVLVAGTDYGVIPHCSKPTLLKSGAEKILNYLGLIARTEIVNRVEDYNVGFFSYECKVYLIDYNGVVKGEGIGITNTREGRYAKSSGYVVQNTVLKMAKKRALVDAALNVGNLSARFTQDMEDLKDLNPESDNKVGKNPEDLKPKNGKPTAKDKPATKKQFTLLEKLMKESNSSEAAMNRYVQKNYGIDDYRKINTLMASELIEKFQEAAKQ